MEYNSNSNYRYERKFLLEYYSIYDAIEIIKQNRYMFREVYEPRSVNNIYFDSLNFNSLNENINGLPNKRKIRIRWYGRFFDSNINAKIEVKIKEGHLGFKQIYSLVPFNINSSINPSVFQAIFESSNLPNMLCEMTKFNKPVCVNTYNRRYFQTFDKKYRMTIDDNILFGRFNWQGIKLEKPFLNNPIVLELKYDNELDNTAQNITQMIPFRLSKFSKYVSAMEKFIIYGLL
jgi:hypothetical protein|tara:strand:+ start:1475 stop:2173 length:699 start_codon:yes stop_codon:yes gene_type:complete